MPRRSSPLVPVLIGLALLAWGAQYLLMLAGGRHATAVIDFSARQYGASRGVVRSVYYAFAVPGEGAYRGSAYAAGEQAPVGHISVRYLPCCPAINHPGSKGLLLFYGLLGMLPGLMLVWIPARLYLRRRSLTHPVQAAR